MKLSNEDHVELLFRARDIENEIGILSLQKQKIEIEQDKLEYELDKIYSLFQDEPKEEQLVDEVKPKKLKKPNDKPSKNDTEVQLQEGRS